MNLILFLGSGVSRLSGLPTVGELTDSIFQSPYHQVSYNQFSSGENPDPKSQTVDMTRRIRSVLQLLRDHDESDIKRVGYSPTDDRSSGAIFRDALSTYEDLFFLCEQLRLWHIGLVDNSLVTPLMEKIERKAGELLVGGNSMSRMSNLGSVAERACFFIESVVAEELRPKSLVGLDLILELVTAPETEQLNIVTLNHDTLVEQLLEEKGVDFADGFGERDGDVRWYDDGVYDRSHTKVRVIKLHGSVDWYSFSVDGRSRPAIFVGADVANIRDSEGKQLTPQFRRPSFLSGINKAVAYQRGIYADMHFRFHQLLRQGRLMLMSGYGWGDMAINLRLETWLDQNRSNTLVLLHRSPEELQERSLIMACSYDGWSRCGQLIPIKKWLSEVTLNDVNQFAKGSHLLLKSQNG